MIMGKQSRRTANLSEGSINLDVTEHLHKLQKAEEGFSGQVSCKTKKIQQIESQVLLNKSQGVYQEPSKLINSHNPELQYAVHCVSNGKDQLKDHDITQEMKDCISGGEPGDSIQSTSIADLSIATQTPAASKHLKPSEKRNFYPCSCNSYNESHPLDPMDCGILEYALTGKTKKQVKELPNEAFCSSIQKLLEQPEYKSLKRNCLVVGWIKQASNDSSSSSAYVRSIDRAYRSLNDVYDDLVHSPSLCDDRSEPAGIGNTEDWLDPPKLNVHNHSLLDGIKSLSMEMPLSHPQTKVNFPERIPVISESIETKSHYLNLPSVEFDGTGIKESTSHPNRRQESELMESNITDKSGHTDPRQHLFPDSDRETYSQPRPNNLRGQKGEQRFNLENNSLVTSLNSCHSDSSGYWNDKLLHSHSDFSLPYCENDFCPDDKLELIDSRCSLLAPSGTRWSSTNLSKDKEVLSASDLVERLAILKQKSKNRSIAGRVKRFSDRRLQNWNQNAKFHESEGSDANAASIIASVKRISRFGYKIFTEYRNERNVKV
ncbi:hypothetical protein EYC80_002338 [Monilinia laxa]|uniref:Uncharacterized protein n=1 Tax=Monilinia laxa TaxID=61186 RepID=A0A5N6K3L2_MONLA|nr:hypothetical protein EYC80_002338 [Monilinia laxa]